MQKSFINLFLKYAVVGSTVKRALKVASVVTPILTVLNHSHEILALEFGTRFFLQVGLTFCVPYMVSTYSSAMTEIHRGIRTGELQKNLYAVRGRSLAMVSFPTPGSTLR